MNIKISSFIFSISSGLPTLDVYDRFIPKYPTIPCPRPPNFKIKNDQTSAAAAVGPVNLKKLKNHSSLRRAVYPFSPPADPLTGECSPLFIEVEVGDVLSTYYASHGWAVVRLVYRKGEGWLSDEGQFDGLSLRERIKAVGQLKTRTGKFFATSRSF